MDLIRKEEILDILNIEYEIINDRLIILDKVNLGDEYGHISEKEQLLYIQDGLLNDVTIESSVYISHLMKATTDLLDGTIIKGNLTLSVREIEPGFLDNTIFYGDLNIKHVKEIPDGFLHNKYINGSLDLTNLKYAYANFLSNTTINGYVFIDTLEEAPVGLFDNTLINHGIFLNSLKTYDENFLYNTHVGGMICLDEMSNDESTLLNERVKLLHNGYNEEFNYFYDGKNLSKVLNVINTDDNIIYETPFNKIICDESFNVRYEDIN